MRTINETVASLAGTEIGGWLIHSYYPSKVPPPAAPKMHTKLQQPETQPEVVFDFRAEMRQTRVHVDELLAEGKVDEAERYMEARRQYFWKMAITFAKSIRLILPFMALIMTNPEVAQPVLTQ